MEAGLGFNSPPSTNQNLQATPTSLTLRHEGLSSVAFIFNYNPFLEIGFFIATWVLKDSESQGYTGIYLHNSFYKH